VIALVPVKRLDQAKSRLSDRLDAPARAQLMHDTLRRTVRALQAAAVFERISIVTLDEQVQAWAQGWGAHVISEKRHGLNEALDEARGVCEQTDVVLVIHGDVAWLTVEDVSAMAQLATPPHAVVIAPDRHNRGTNALLLKPPCVIPFAFGENSAQRHAGLAREAGIEPAFYHSPTLGLDVDVAADLRLYEAAPFLLDD
jgi:2-phospho-L-lactate/phosphoenolpyruvate guanylyltransferase